MIGGSRAFELIGSGADDAIAHVTGLWIPGNEASTELLSSAQESALPLVWRVRLPVQARLATASLAAGAARVADSTHAIRNAAQQFGPGVEGALGADTLRWTAMVANLLGGLRDAASAWGELAQRCSRFMLGVVNTIHRPAWVQTYIEERVVGWSIVPFVGRVHTVLPAALDRREIDLHLRSVELTISSRAALVQWIVTIVRGAAIVSKLVATPIGPLAAFLMAWHLIHTLVAEARWNRSRPQPHLQSTPSW